jgi:hypothetical protein
MVSSELPVPNIAMCMPSGTTLEVDKPHSHRLKRSWKFGPSKSKLRRGDATPMMGTNATMSSSSEMESPFVEERSGQAPHGINEPGACRVSQAPRLVGNSNRNPLRGPFLPGA